MIQYTVDRHGGDPAKQVENAIKGGIKWIEVPQGLTLHELDSIESLCKKAGVFLLICNDIEFAEEKRWHGIHLDYTALPTAAQTRLKLGAHAIIGVDIKSLEETCGLDKADIDYAVMDVNESNLDDMLQIDKSVKSIPVVARIKGLKPAQAAELLNSGFNGINLTNEIDSSSSVNEYIENLYKALS